MNYVYILRSRLTGRYYIGSTNDINRRIIEHNAGKTVSLRGHVPLDIVFRKEYATLLEARRMEMRLKKKKSRVILEAIVRDQEIKGP